MWIAPERRSATRWAVPALALTAGVAAAVLLTMRGQGTTGLVCLAVLAGYALHLAFRRTEGGSSYGDSFGGGRSRTQVRAAAVAGDAVIGALVAAVVVQGLRGAEILPYAWPLGVAALAYVLSSALSPDGP
ncbi:ABC transporter permease [Actinomadura craniellae]|uniref:ABC transporter permease n=1 Tax=Actinomadura craniellae TaxID=2231787 RepID=A0A365H487_9ACTN|nr:ABC transporter permease [Actinomadura craniellae]RAY13925.1 ABC transporter permease [Actinomadura craniellae]